MKLPRLQTVIIGALLLVLLFILVGQNRDAVWIFGFSGILFFAAVGLAVFGILAVVGFMVLWSQLERGVLLKPEEEVREAVK